MRHELPGRIRRFLRSPRLVTAEVVTAAAAGVVSTLLPQQPSALEAVRFAERHPAVAALARPLGLFTVFETPWFLALVALSLCSLAVVVWDQWARGLREWRTVPTAASFGAAPFRVEFERVPRGGAAEKISTHARVAVLGAPIFHAGLLVVVLAGVARLLWSGEAFVNLCDEEAIPTTASGFALQRLGWLAAPVAPSSPVRVLKIQPRWYPTGKLEALGADLAVGAPPNERQVRTGINAPLDLGTHRVYLHQRFGIAALVEVSGSSEPIRRIAMLELQEDGTYASREILENGVELRLRGATSGQAPVGVVELRALERGILRAVEKVRRGEVVALGGGKHVVVHDLRWWAQFSVTRDLSVWPAFAGFLLMAAGALLMLAFGRVDVLVAATRAGDRERVLVALRARRLAPLYAERFARTVRAEGGAWEW